VAVLLAGAGAAARLATSGETNSGHAQTLEAYGKLPLAFEPNRGQAGAGVRFLARGSGYGLALTRTGAILALQKPVRPSPSRTNSRGRDTGRGRAAALGLRFVGANEGVRLVAGRPLPGKVNYLLGNDSSKWLTGIDTFGEVRYRGLYPGVDARFYGRQGRLEYDLVVAPGADPARIGLALRGARTLRLNPYGGLLVRLPDGILVQGRPQIYQTIAGRKEPVAGGYVLRGRDRFGFRLGAYDKRRPLVIDPVLAYSSYLGGSDFDNGTGIAVDAAGAAYVTGETASMDFPTTPGAFDTSPNGGSDAFVAKVAPSGASLAYSTYLGGGRDIGDRGFGIAVDAAGSAYVTGITFSADFPTTPGAFDTFLDGDNDGFVAKLAPSGASLVYSTYLGGSTFERSSGIAVDAGGSAYVAGGTGSADFPTTPGALDTSLGGGNDAFVAKLAASGASLDYSTYLGGSDLDDGSGIAVDAAGAAYVTGTTFSADFPTTPGAFDASLGGFEDAYATKLAASGASLVYSTYLGGSEGDDASSIAVDAAGSAYVTGDTDSADFPTTPDALDTSLDGFSDAFAAKLSASGASLLYSTYLGGSDSDDGFGIAVDAAGSAYVTGITFSADFPTTSGALDTSLGGFSDAFVAKVAASGGSLLYSTYLGGSKFDQGLGIAVDAAGSAYVTGITVSADFPTTSGAFDTSYNGGDEAFVAKLTAAATVSVLVDIKPGSARNPINLRSHGVISVAILSTESFDATTVVATSVCFGDAEDSSQRDCSEAHGKGHVEDVNGDGRLDLLLHFETQQTGIDRRDTTACLTGTTRDGLDVEGCDSITIV
jgi:hypothetical protein